MSVQHQKFAAKALTIEVAIIALVVVPVAGYAAFNFAVTPQSGLADDAGLVGHWTFDGSTMLTNVADSSGQGNIGYLQGFTSTTTFKGVIGQALQLNGTSNYVSTSTSASISLKTISFWARASTTAAIAQGLSNIGGGGTSIVVDSSYSEANQDSNYLLATISFTGQCFTSSGGALDSVKYYLKKVGSPTGNATAKLYLSTGTMGSTAVPTGSVLGTSDNFDVSTLTTSYQLVTINFSGAERYTMSNGTGYCVTIDYTSGNPISNYLHIGYDASSPSHAGNRAWLNSGPWTAEAGQDLVFYVYAEQSGTPTNISTDSAKAISATGFTSPTYYIDGAVTASPALNDAEWHHIAVTTGTTINVSQFEIGRANGVLFGGAIDDVRIYNRALTAAEVKRLYDVGATAKVAVSPKTGLASPTQADGTASGLVGWWTFDGANLLQNATDSSGQGKNGNLINFTSTTTVAGRIGQALTFNGSNNQVIAPQTATGAPMSLCAWFKSASATARQTILSVTPATANDQALRLEIRGDAAGDPVEATTNQNATVASADTTTGYTVNKWHHGCAVFHSSTDRRAYIDGGSVGTNTTSATPTGVNETTIGIRGGTSDDRLFDGAIDDARVYNRALSAAEVLRLYQVGSTAKIGAATESGLGSATKADGSSNGLLGWWTFDGANLLQNATDSSGSGSNGQLLSFTSTTTIMGKLGQALNFDGTDDYIQTPVDLKAATDFTLSAWFKADLTDFAHLIFWQGVSSGNGWGLADEMHLAIGSLADGSATTISNELSFTYMDSGAGNPSASDLNARIAFTDTNKFHHVVAVVSGLATSPNVDLWLDGVLVASDTGTATLSGASWDTNLRIGRPGLSTRIFDGTLDDMRVYNRALSAAEVKRLYQLGI